MVRSCGAALGFFAFAVTVLLGLVAGNPTDAILTRAIQALFLFFFLGLFVGWVAYRVIDEYAVGRHSKMFPSADLSDDEPAEEPSPGDETA
jgi:hypothetical protein